MLQLYLSYYLLSICRVSKVVWKIREFCFLDTAKLCINIYAAYLCIFLFVPSDPPRPETAGLEELCVGLLHPSSALFLGAPQSPMTLRPGILFLTPQLFLLGGRPGQHDSCLWQLLA